MLQHPTDGDELQCMHERIFGCLSVCLSILSRCAGMIVCCNASCFANCLRSAEGCDAGLGGVEARAKREEGKY